MMKNLKYIYIILFLGFGIFQNASAQTEESLITVEATVINEAGEALSDIVAYSEYSNITTVTDMEGHIGIEVLMNDVVIVDVFGYKRSVNRVFGGAMTDTIVLIQEDGLPLNQKQNIIFGDRSFDRLTGSVSRISGEMLSDVPSIYVQEAMMGRMAGVTTNIQNSHPAYESYGISLWGSSITDVFVDGVPGSLGVTSEEIDHISIGKDLSSTSLIGGTAFNGILMAETKKGTAFDNHSSIKYNSGIRMPTFMPEMMDAVQYVSFFNTALENDGLAPIYTQEMIDAYANGTDPIRYPNINYQNLLLNDDIMYQNVAANISGGDEIATYSTHIGAYVTEGMEKGIGTGSLRLRARANLALKLADYGKLDLAIGGLVSAVNSPNVAFSSNSLFTTASRYPANASSIMLNDSTYSYSSEYPTNPLMMISDRGTSERNTRYGFTRLGLNLDLGNVLQGLSLNSMVGFNINNYFIRSIDPTADQYEPIFVQGVDGQDSTILVARERKADDSTWEVDDHVISRDLFIKSGFNYDRSFGDDHQVTADATYYQRAVSGNKLEQDNRMQVYSARANYMFKGKYVIDGAINHSGSQFFIGDKRFETFYNGGAAWILSKESFLEDASWLDYAKLRISSGSTARSFTMINGDPLTYYLTRSLYAASGSYGYGVQGATSGYQGYFRTFTGNPEIDWQKTFITNAGLDMMFLQHKLSSSINIFSVRDYNTIILPENIYALMSSDQNRYQYLAYENYGEEIRRGMDMQLSYSDKKGSFSYMIDGNMMYLTSEIVSANVLNYPEAERSIIGKQGDLIMGLESDGYFVDEDDIAASEKQYFGAVRPGDLKYVDSNQDGKITEEDYHPIGHAPRVFYGLNVMLNYKNFTLGIHGNGRAGGHVVDTRYWGKGNYNYLASTTAAYEAGDIPLTSAIDGANNSQVSDFWLVKADYFNISSINLAYHIPHKVVSRIGVEDLKVFVGGRNLFLISQMEELYAPYVAGGYTTHPVMKSVELGLEVSF